MIVDCHSCGATYNISDDKVRGRRVRVRCKTCGEGIIVDGAALDDATRVYSPQFEPAAYSEDKDESTRVMSAGGMEWREPGPDEWTVNLSDTEQRTMTLQDLVSAYNSGTVGEDAYVWRDGMADWLPLRQVPEINAALDSGESTRVMSQAALRAATAGPPPSVPTTPGPTAWAPPRAAAARAVLAPTPVTYAAPAAPPRAVRTVPPPAASVEYAPSRPSAPPRGAAPARVRENRARADLFGGRTDAETEEELLRSSSVPLAQYDEKPTGARNENSVLFSLNTLKAGAPRGGGHNSAPPRMLTASPPTAADILGMTAGGAFGGMDGGAALLSAPRVDAPVPPPAPAAPPIRDRMDTTPPTMRGRPSLALLAGILVLALGVAAGAFFVLRSRLVPAQAAPSAAVAPAEPSSVPVPSTAATTQMATSAAAPAEAPAPPAPVPPPAEIAAPTQPTIAAPPVAPPPTKAAPAPGAGLKAALRPEKAPTPPAEAPAEKGGKVVLEEEPQSAPAEEEAPKPPFDTGAAKTALAAAAAGAAGCKKPDGPTGSGKVQVTFSPSGRATSANVIEGAFGGTPVGGCVAKAFRSARVPAFSGDPVTVAKSFNIPE